MKSNPPYKSLGIIAVNEEKLKCVDHDGNELNHLEGRQVFFPPQVGLDLWSEGSKKIIRVHYNVDK